ncbi:hypothetical protein AALP_AAs54320U000100, partial [Arabis alpina]
ISLHKNPPCVTFRGEGHGDLHVLFLACFLVLDMESTILNYLKFEMTAPTTKCFLRRFVHAAHGVHEAPLMQLK